MMYFKLAKRNMHRSIKEYAVYYITLVFSVALFYCFNSIEDQSVFLDLDKNWSTAFKEITMFLNAASVFVIFILAFLILYSNNFLYRRRKKELGIYLTLGMENSGISKIMFIEMIILGAVSLAFGLLLGIFASQILSVFTANLFNVEMTGFVFIFSTKALIRTIMAFGAIYIIVGMFNVLSVRTIKLIDLLNAHKKNEKIKIKSPVIAVIMFLISLAVIGSAYYIVLRAGIAELDRNTIYAIILGVIGTFLFFMSLSGFLLSVLKKREGIYFKNLNMFLVRQLNSRVNSAFTSISFICLMLFLAICMLSSGVSLNTVMNKDVDVLSPYDVTLYNYSGADIEQGLKEYNLDLKDYAKDYHYMNIYTDDLKYSDILGDKIMKENDSYYPIKTNADAEFMKLSDLNIELKNLGHSEISLKDNEFLIISNVESIFKDSNEMVKDNKKIKVSNKEYSISKEGIMDFTFYNSSVRGILALAVLPDSAFENSNMQSYNSYLNVNYKNNIDESTKESSYNVFQECESCFHATREDIINIAKGTGAAISFLAIYLGVIFIIASSAVLAIQQLSGIDDNIERYSMLKKIGTEENMIFKSVKTEVGIYFGMPLILAVVHSIVGLKLANGIIGIFGSGTTILRLMIISSFFILIIYGTYYLGTYICAKSLIRRKV